MFNAAIWTFYVRYGHFKLPQTFAYGLGSTTLTTVAKSLGKYTRSLTTRATDSYKKLASWRFADNLSMYLCNIEQIILIYWKDISYAIYIYLLY